MSDTVVVKSIGSDGIKNATKSAAAKDLVAIEETLIHPGGRALIKSGLKVEIPEGYAMWVTPRSGLALKHGITVLNSPGLIDSDYRGDVGIILQNTSEVDFLVSPGDRVAQAMLIKLVPFKFDEVLFLNDTERGEGGFGHTGR